MPISRPQALVGTGRRNGNASASKKLLVCAPSNAAVDELVMRFKQGIKTVDGASQSLSVIRLGRSDAINANVLDVTLEELVTTSLNLPGGKKNGGGDDIHKIMMEHKSTSERLNALRSEMDEIKASGKPVSAEHDREFEVLKRRRQQFSNQIDTARDNGDMATRDAEMNRRRVQQEILDGAHVICATLSGSGHEMFQGLNIEFETVVIDEAAQSIELSALIPLKYGCSKCILVGDPKQLPPTVLSREAARFQYEQSLFVRMQTNHPNDVHLLDTQYRMHPEISLFPSNAFYDARLLDGPGMAKLRTRPWHRSKVLSPYRFFDVQGTHQSVPRGHSLINVAEIEVALKLYDRLVTDCKGYDFTGKVGIITPYKSQLRELRSRFAQRYGDVVFAAVEFNTTDAFQGRESEVIIFSCVRASLNGGIGFLSDIRRMNVGITRAKSSLWVLGNSQSLMRGEFWARLMQDAKTRDRYTSGDLIGLLKKPLLYLDDALPAYKWDSPVTSASASSSHDTDMPDAPVARSEIPASRRSSTITDVHPVEASAALSRRPLASTDFTFASMMLDDAKPMPYSPAGGANGLNSQANCQMCGSFAHFTNRCDNRDAQSLGSNKCYRCGDAGHKKTACTRERCLICGDFGHIQNNCSNAKTLSSKEKERLVKVEAEFRFLLQRAPEIQRKRQLGEHGMQVPVVRTTADTLSPITTGQTVAGRTPQIGEKRKREPSPPASAPKGPKAPNGSLTPIRQDATRVPYFGSQLLSRVPNVFRDGNSSDLVARSSLPPRTHESPRRLEDQGPPSIRPSDGGAILEARKADRNGGLPRDSYNGKVGGSRDHLLPVRLEHSSNKVIKVGEGSSAAPRRRLPLPPQNMVRPPRKKKDTDPFIRPRKRP